ncbi:MAG TPA: sulfite exporter TauE/SafE family protein [Alphaproteobacteria bacterium]|jgi:uncharacterized membrane protein YfcA
MSPDLLLYALIGFAAQLVDGALGMGYGIVATSSLLAAGVPPALASATVHVTKVPTGIASGFWHWRAGNVDVALCRRLLLPGLVGGVIGASAVSLAPGNIVRPLAALYLSLMGIVVVARLLRSPAAGAQKARAGIAGFAGGLFDSMGGGWGPIATSTLLAGGHAPRETVGSVSAVEPLVAALQAAIFGAWLGAGALAAAGGAALGLVAGALVAAPLAAQFVRRAPRRITAIAIGAALLLLNLPILFLAMGGARLFG